MSYSGHEPDAELRPPSHSHSRSLSSISYGFSHSRSPSQAERRPSTQFPHSEYSFDLERFHMQGDRRHSFRSLEVEECSTATSAGTLVWVENRRSRLSSSPHRGPAYITELRYLQFGNGHPEPKYIKRHEYRQALDNLYKSSLRTMKACPRYLKDFEEMVSPLNAHVVAGAAEQLDARRLNLLALSRECSRM